MPEQLKNRRKTSPPSPSFPLTRCLEDTEKLYSQYGHNPFSRSEIAATLELSSTSGPFRQRLASLKMYGLITPASDGQLTISQTFELIHFAEENSYDYRKAVFSAINNAATFKEILHHFNEQLPNQQALTKKLEIDMGFNHNTATHTAKTLTTSLTQASLLDSKGNLIPIRDEYGQQTNQTSHSEKTINSKPLPQQQKLLQTEIPLKDNRVITISYPIDITEEDANKASEVLSALSKN